MSYIGKKQFVRSNNIQKEKNKKFYQAKWFKIIAVIAIILIIGGGIFLWKADSFFKKISNGGIFQTLVHNIPGVDNQLKGEKEGRINVLLLGMRGANDPAGGTLADTIMILSVEPKMKKVALISIPRDLFVDNSAVGYKTKLNAVYAYGERKGNGQGIKYMEKTISSITGIPIHYAVVINFNGFKKIIDIIGGVKITLDKPFEESVQFNQPQVCDKTTFTIPTGKYENKTVNVYFPGTKKIKRKRIIKSYPLCTNAHPECNGVFKLSAGTHILNSTDALCYARSRETSNDFKRAKRQQEVLQAVKNQLLSAGTLTNFAKLNGILNNLGDNVKTDMQIWEMKRFYDLYKKMQGYQLYQRVIDSSDNSQTGLVYGKKDATFGDILLLKGNNYNKIQNLFQNIFNSNLQENKKSSSD